MPIYDFRCQECGRVSEVFIRGAEQALRCPGCGSANLERLVSSSYVVRTSTQAPGTTCCGRTERCETPPCHTDEGCRRRHESGQAREG